MTGYSDHDRIKGPLGSASNPWVPAPEDHNLPETNREIDDGGHTHVVQRPSSGPLGGLNQDHGSGQAHQSSPLRDVPFPTPGADYDVPDTYANLDEVVGVSPIQNPNEQPIHRYQSLEGVRGREQEERLSQQRRRASIGILAAEQEEKEKKAQRQKAKVSKLATQIYTVSYLTLFSILGTLARLGLQALVGVYPGAPVIFPSLWPNFAGSLVMGFLAEDVRLFHREVTGNGSGSSTPAKKDEHTDNNTTRQMSEPPAPQTSASETTLSSDPAAAKKSHLAVKKTIPLYIGLATGFCGSFTSFSSFMRDIFLALSNDLTSPPSPRNGGYSLSAVLAVILVTLSLSLSGLFIGAHIAIALHPILPSLPSSFTGKILDKTAVVFGLGAWLASIFLCIFPPDRQTALSEETESWRGAVTFALAFAPLGCLLRFYLSTRLNSRVARFPLGTFAANILGTAILGMAWDVAHIPVDSVSCQVLQGIQDGFCGCLTTVSTWVSELAVLRRKNAYVYGGVSVAVGFGLLVAIMGGMRWGGNDGMGFRELRCVHSFG
ncbi:CrcB-like domain containing protein [Naviculisporaceae sp. PSN 640]